VLIVDYYDSSQVIGERMKLRAMWIKEDSKSGPKRPNIGKTAAQNEASKHA